MGDVVILVFLEHKIKKCKYINKFYYLIRGLIFSEEKIFFCLW